MFKKIILLITAYCVTGGHGADWTYKGEHGTHHWAEMFPYCAGQSQSPIDLQTTSQEDFMFDPSLSNDLDVVKGKDRGDYYMVNNGHTVYIDTTAAEVKVFGASLGTTYKVIGPHFHWGTDDSKGSEHLINGVAYPLEMHIVTYNEKFSTLKEAVMSGEQGALAVVGVMFQIVPEDNPILEPIIQNLDQVIEPDKEKRVLIDYFELKDLLPGDTSEFFRYSGSLTTPTCDEVVTWTSLLQPQSISRSQLAKFRMLVAHQDPDGNPINIQDNFRPVQPLNGRKVKKTFDYPSIAFGSSSQGNGAAARIGQTITVVCTLLAAFFIL